MSTGNSEFTGLVALVTGGASGIGAATAATLRARGATVYVVDRDAGEAGDGAQVLTADVTDSAAVEAAVAEVVSSAGRLDVLVNNAGIGAVGTVADNSLEEWQRTFDVNVLGIVRVSRAALPHLRRSPAAAIVNTCSVAADVGLPLRALYSATKGAVLSLTRAMAADHVREGIRVCCVNPGTADTPWVGRLLAQAEDPTGERAALEARQPSGRLVTADEVAAAIAFLAGPRSGATTGTALTVDGGLTGLRLPPSG
jgi:2-keto-3-deoxy-L-fuconate dehydrogenase